MDGRGKCINLGPCNMGCPQGAKSSVDVTYWPKALKNGVMLKPNSRVKEITIDSKDRATGVIYFNENGEECFQKAKLIIGNIDETSKTLFEVHDPAPILAMFHDFDYYSSSKEAFMMLDKADKYYLPKIYTYFDDVMTIEVEL